MKSLLPLLLFIILLFITSQLFPREFFKDDIIPTQGCYGAYLKMTIPPEKPSVTKCNQDCNITSCGYTDWPSEYGAPWGTKFQCPDSQTINNNLWLGNRRWRHEGRFFPN